MNPNTTHRAWHPGEDDDYMRAAVARVRERCGMSDERSPEKGTRVDFDQPRLVTITDDALRRTTRHRSRCPRRPGNGCPREFAPSVA